MMVIEKAEEGAKGGKRSSSKSETIERVLEAARREFATNGLARANMEAIARAAGVTKQLLYQYYESKHDLFTAVLDRTSADVMPELLELNFDDMEPVPALRRLCEEVFEQYRRDPLLGPLAREGLRFHEENHSPHNRFVALVPLLVGKLDGIVRRGVASGDFRPDIDTRACTAMVSLMMTGGFTNQYTLSVILGANTVSPEGMEMWRKIAADFVIEAFRNKSAPA